MNGNYFANFMHGSHTALVYPIWHKNVFFSPTGPNIQMNCKGSKRLKKKIPRKKTSKEQQQSTLYSELRATNTQYKPRRSHFEDQVVLAKLFSQFHWQ